MGTDADALALTGNGGATAFSSGITVDQVSVATRAQANDALDAMDAAISTDHAMRADLGAVQNRFARIEVAGVQMERSLRRPVSYSGRGLCSGNSEFDLCADSSAGRPLLPWLQANAAASGCAFLLG